MQRPFIVGLIFWVQAGAFAQFHKVPFFENTQFQAGSRELVIFTHEPQSEFVIDFGARIYTDDAFLQKVNSEFYFLVDTTQERIVDFCGFDLFFYEKTGPNLRLIKKMNSGGCSMSAQEKQFMQEFAVHGEKLETDTLPGDSIPYNTASELYEDGIILSYFEGFEPFDSRKTHYTNAANFESLFYTGRFQITLSNGSPTALDELIDAFFDSLGIMHPEQLLINWKIKSFVMNGYTLTKTDVFFFKSNKVDSAVVEFQLDTSAYELFKGITIDGVYFTRPLPMSLIVYRIP